LKRGPARARVESVREMPSAAVESNSSDRFEVF
jgi:hypothetical protein